MVSAVVKSSSKTRCVKPAPAAGPGAVGPASTMGEASEVGPASTGAASCVDASLDAPPSGAPVSTPGVVLSTTPTSMATTSGEPASAAALPDELEQLGNARSAAR